MEDVLLLTAGMLAEDERVAAQVRRQYKWFVVDEFQDVSPLQSALLDLWLGGRDEICVVGDPAQTIYSFAGADAGYLRGFPAKFPGTTSVELVRNYRSSPQVVEAANRLLARLAEPGRRAARPGAGRAAGHVHAAARRGRRGVVRRGAGPRPAPLRAGRRRDRGAVPDQRAVRVVRGGAGRARHPLRRARRGPVLRPARGARGGDPGPRRGSLGAGRGDGRRRRPRSSAASSPAWAGPPRRPPRAGRPATAGSRGRRSSTRPWRSSADDGGDLGGFVDDLDRRAARAARAGRRRGHPGDVPRRQGTRVGLGVLLRAAGRHPADHLRRDARPRSRRSAGCCTSA